MSEPFTLTIGAPPDPSRPVIQVGPEFLTTEQIVSVYRQVRELEEREFRREMRGMADYMCGILDTGE